MSAYWSSCLPIGHHVCLLAIMSVYWPLCQSSQQVCLLHSHCGQSTDLRLARKYGQIRVPHNCVSEPNTGYLALASALEYFPLEYSGRMWVYWSVYRSIWWSVLARLGRSVLVTRSRSLLVSFGWCYCPPIDRLHLHSVVPQSIRFKRRIRVAVFTRAALLVHLHLLPCLWLFRGMLLPLL